MALTSLVIDGRIQLIDAHAMGDRMIEGLIADRPVTIHRIGKSNKWRTEKPEDLALIEVSGAIPEPVFRAVCDRLDANHTLSWSSVLTKALSFYLLQEGVGGPEITRAYVDSSFPESA